MPVNLCPVFLDIIEKSLLHYISRRPSTDHNVKFFKEEFYKFEIDSYSNLCSMVVAILDLEPDQNIETISSKTSWLQICGF